jgi:uncharacterized repeat protein (TIGR03803 family)
LAGLVQAAGGNFYGTTQGGSGGANNYGTVFEITSVGTLKTLQTFNYTDGSNPEAALVQATDGTFYGTSSQGGTNNGTIFSLSVGLAPFVKTLPTSGKVGAAVKILGTDLMGPAGVTFNGTPAAITFISPSEISTTVPAGAATGKVQVTTPGGTLLSNIAFRITP